MTWYTGGTNVKGGYYWNARSWEVEAVPSEGGRLEGAADARFVKVPFPVLFVIVPLLGLLFLLFLPLTGFALFAYFVTKKVTSGVRRSAAELAATLEPGKFAAGVAHFTGKPVEGEKATSEPRKREERRSTEIAKLEKEIAERKSVE